MGICLRWRTLYESEGKISMINLDVIEKALNHHSLVADYEIHQKKRESIELFYVFDKLETNRYVDTTATEVTLYVDIDDKRGSSSFSLIAADNEESLKRKIELTITKAKSALNPFYPLAEVTSQNIQQIRGCPKPLSELAKETAAAIFAAKSSSNVTLNATEIFVHYEINYFRNSRKVAHQYDKVSIFLETIPSLVVKENTEEYESYFSIEINDRELDCVTAKIEKAMQNVIYRSQARSLKDLGIKGEMQVEISSEMLAKLFSSFANDINYRSCYEHNNHFDIQSKISKVPFSICLEGKEDCPVDRDGIVLSPRMIIKDGHVVSSWGALRFGHYLHEKEISGTYPLAHISCPEAYCYEKVEGPYLKILSFSSPQLDEASGYFGGEVRLALYINKDEIIPLSGFSISGNLYEAIQDVCFSMKKDSFCNDEFSMDYHGPQSILFPKINCH